MPPTILIEIIMIMCFGSVFDRLLRLFVFLNDLNGVIAPARFRRVDIARSALAVSAAPYIEKLILIKIAMVNFVQ